MTNRLSVEEVKVCFTVYLGFLSQTFTIQGNGDYNLYSALQLTSTLLTSMQWLCGNSCTWAYAFQMSYLLSSFIFNIPCIFNRSLCSHQTVTPQAISPYGNLHLTEC